MTARLPKFANPPVVETLLGVQFDPLVKMRITDYGLFWDRIRDDFPVVEEHPPLQPAVESPSTRPLVHASAQWRIGGNFPLPRVWYRAVANELAAGQYRGIQLQPDRFMQNWMRSARDSSRYPSYEANRAEFLKYLNIFNKFASDRNLDPLNPNQCEVTYVNRIPLEMELDAVFQYCFPSLTVKRSTDFLPKPESLNYVTSFQMGPGNGRLHVLIRGPVSLEPGGSVIDFRLTARGAPKGRAVDDVMRWLDLGREWVVRGFHCLTSAEMHRKWGYEND
jgi:uncharacterized protein (TIGR04255 family)